ncbi:MAG TPA: MBL fold metallo-hydrolase, partial [Pyrinomonadaceae bacterium]|nr:MBL fold metallo-hydrolase [Pyrinomonadaceae bacterium]
MKILPISVPTPFYVGDVNVYLIREDPVTLIDVGPKTPEAAEALRGGLAAHGVKFSDIHRIVLTHAHEDHCGLAKQVRDEARNAEILMHPWEGGHLTGRLSQEASRKLLMRSGVPAGV